MQEQFLWYDVHGCTNVAGVCCYMDVAIRAKQDARAEVRKSNGGDLIIRALVMMCTQPLERSRVEQEWCPI